MTTATPLDVMLARIRACRVCVDQPKGAPLPHAPRPVVRARPSARIAVCGQAPGIRVHASGMPFTDRSGERLRAWMGVTDAEFYDDSRVAIVPMGFCFPGLNKSGADLPPRRECAETWHAQLLPLLENVDLLLLIGLYAVRWHLARVHAQPLTDVVARWRDFVEPRPSKLGRCVRMVPLPHPSWRNTGWLKANPWFADELVPALQSEVRSRL